MKTLIAVLVVAGLIGSFGAKSVISLLAQTPASNLNVTSSTTSNPDRLYQWQNPNTSTGSSGSNTVTSSQPSSNQTINWAGYEASGGSFTSVSGNWIAPTVTSSGLTSADATWIGIGGVSSSDLIQVGTQNVVSPDGQVSTSAFYELLPDTSQTIPSVTVNPGDSVTASISETSANVWTINFVDSTTGTNYSVSVNYQSSLSSAEWIEEDPSDGLSQIPLDNFGTATFNAGSTTENGNNVSISGSNAQALTMIDSSGQVLANTSALGSKGSFTVNRSSITSGQGISEFNQYPSRWTRHGIGIGRTQSDNGYGF